jgi:hypothetical protein
MAAFKEGGANVLLDARHHARHAGLGQSKLSRCTVKVQFFGDSDNRTEIIKT